MKLKLQKRLSADVFKRSKKKIHFNEEMLEEIKEAITKADIRGLIKKNAVIVEPIRGISRVRARKTLVQKSKGRQKGKGSRKGKKTARMPRKRSWILRIRKQRVFLKELRKENLIEKGNFRDLYLKAKGGFFRSKRHLKIYINEHNIIKNEKNQ